MSLRPIVQSLRSFGWGNWCLLSLYVSVVSGIIVGIQYNPTHPYYSVTALELLVPYGAFFRSLHFYSSQAFFLFAIIHFLCTHQETKNYTRKDWTMLMASLPVIVLLLFTGYVLRADRTGVSAGMIAESILLTIPWVGKELNELFFSITRHGMLRVYLHHVITFDLILLFLLWKHLRRYRVMMSNHIIFLSLLIVFSMVITAPLEPEKAGISYISGPWFFLGLQELLRYFAPLFAGVLVPSLFLIAFFHLYQQGKYYRFALWFCNLWLVCYLLLTLIAWNR